MSNSKKCYLCKGKLIDTKNLVIHKGKTIPILVEKCESCGETFSTPEETERVRKEIHPSILDKIKNIFSSKKATELSWFKGRVL